jgi:hypothetical protein
MIAGEQREKRVAARLCGERVLRRLESLGVGRLADPGGRDPWINAAEGEGVPSARRR